MLTRKQAENLATTLAITSIGWPPKLEERKKQVIKEILQERENILNILDNELRQIQE